MKKKEFLQIANELNEKLSIVPLLFGSLGLEQRLKMSLNAEDIDVLIPEEFLNIRWQCIVDIMNDNGYTLYDLHEHAFDKDGLSLAYASIESLTPFANIDIANIPIVNEDDIRYYLLELPDYLKVYAASSQDGYRNTIKNKQDQQKIDLIHSALAAK
ncbi:MAG: hypothetical protein K2I14_09445 [Eubacterium sp.]|nr:hypothetical protein [Eubacterium sp.]